MSKKYKGKICAYCAKNESTSADHIIAREFFPNQKRDNLPKVPACTRCNNKKSEIEHYLTTVLPFGAQHCDAHRNLSEDVPRRLARNKKLNDELGGLQHRWLKQTDSEVLVPSTTLSFRPSALPDWLEFVTKGLIFYHWKGHLSPGDGVSVKALTQAGLESFDRYIFALRPDSEVRGDYGDGVFEYIGRRGVDSKSLSAWKFRVLGGATVSDGLESSATFVALAGPRSILAKWL